MSTSSKKYGRVVIMLCVCDKVYHGARVACGRIIYIYCELMSRMKSCVTMLYEEELCESGI